LAGIGDFTITYTVVVSGCTFIFTKTVTVKNAPIPTVSTSAASTESVCENDDPILLQGSPAGGTFFGKFVDKNKFFPSNMSVGTNEMSYSVKYSSGCTATKKFNVTVTKDAKKCAKKESIIAKFIAKLLELIEKKKKS
jgi:hypothetical protein